MLIAWLKLTCQLKMEQNNSECFSFDVFFTAGTSVLCASSPFCHSLFLPPLHLCLPSCRWPGQTALSSGTFHSKRDNRNKPSELENWAGCKGWKHLSASEQTFTGLQDFACSTCVLVNSSEGSLYTFMYLLLLVLLPLPWLDFSWGHRQQCPSGPQGYLSWCLCLTWVPHIEENGNRTAQQYCPWFGHRGQTSTQHGHLETCLGNRRTVSG